MLPCSWKETFGVECPACGAQRSFFELISGEIWTSIQLFPAMIPLIFAIITAIMHLTSPKRFPVKWTVYLFVMSGVIMFVSWLYKIM